MIRSGNALLRFLRNTFSDFSGNSLHFWVLGEGQSYCLPFIVCVRFLSSPCLHFVHLCTLVYYADHDRLGPDRCLFSAFLRYRSLLLPAGLEEHVGVLSLGASSSLVSFRRGYGALLFL